MEKFDELKETMLNVAMSPRTQTCVQGLVDLKNCKSVEDLIRAAKTHFVFSVERNFITPELIKEYYIECAKQDLYCNENVKNGYVLVTSGGEAIAEGHSVVIAVGEAKVEARDCSVVYAYDQAEVTAWDDCTVIAKGDSQIYPKDTVKVHAYEHAWVHGGYHSYTVCEDDALFDAVDSTAICVNL